MKHLPNYHFCHKNLVSTFFQVQEFIDIVIREICLYLLATKKKNNIWQRTQLQVKPNHDIYLSYWDWKKQE